MAKKRSYWIFVEVISRVPVYVIGLNGKQHPWAFPDRGIAESVLDRLGREGRMMDGHPFNREWIDVVELDDLNYARYLEVKDL